jgi:hypothetical protein
LPNICFLKQFSFHGTLHLGVRVDTDNKQHNKQKIKCKTQFWPFLASPDFIVSYRRVAVCLLLKLLVLTRSVCLQVRATALHRSTLMEIFQSIADKENGQPTSIDYKKASKQELADFMASVLPDYDRDRVHDSDIKKLIQWYNILVNGGYTKFVDESEAVAETAEVAE